MSNPRNFTSVSTSSLSGIFLITPNDTVDLEQFPVALRIWNSNSTPSTISIQTVAGDDIVLTIPPTTTSVEPVSVARVLATGTSSGLIIHGYK